jgi:serine protease Do
MREQKLLSLSLMLFTLAIGIVIGTLVNTGVRAGSGQSAAPDATPLVIPPVAKLSTEFSKLAKQLEPSVVNITTEFSAKSQQQARRPPVEDEDEEGADLFRRFFRGQPQPQPRYRRGGEGSGFIVDKNGYIITNHHVIDRADTIRVKLNGDRTDYKAKLIGTDVETDLAVLKIDAGHPLTAARIGNSDAVQVGDWAVAIGSPFGLEATVTAGIVSATGRDVTGARQFQRFIQTDAAINPGNSGGPLLNINGEVIGVNSMIATQSGGYQGIGFALPVNMAVRVYNSVIKTGRVSRGSIGVSWRKYEKAEVLKATGLSQGVLVESVTDGGPAQKAGVKPEDVIVGLNGRPVKDGDDLVARVSELPVGSDATITVDREGKKLDMKLTIVDREELFKDDPVIGRNRRQDVEPSPSEGATQARFGIAIRNLGDAERDNLKLPDNRGVMVTRVEPDSFADEIGLQEKDIIVSINRQPVSSADDVKRIQGTLKAGDAVAFRVLRPGPTQGRGGERDWQSLFVAGTLPQ